MAGSNGAFACQKPPNQIVQYHPIPWGRSVRIRYAGYGRHARVDVGSIMPVSTPTVELTPRLYSLDNLSYFTLGKSFPNRGDAGAGLLGVSDF